jgi:hypothetical protein
VHGSRLIVARRAELDGRIRRRRGGTERAGHTSACGAGWRDRFIVTFAITVAAAALGVDVGLAVLLGVGIGVFGGGLGVVGVAASSNEPE